ncbi:MAG: glycosyltransferase family 4 protein [Alphaproteobacteria bacterium]|nr:glycosyltransferase family 4 protein [Alphaproteobacteria bacterium]
MKKKLLFDVEQLAADGLKGTGVVRVCDELLRRLVANDEVDVYPVIVSGRGDFEAYLKAKGLYKKLKNKIVYMPKLKSTTKNLNIFQKINSYCLIKFCSYKYKNILAQYDAYISMFTPISPVVYQSKLKTYMIIHDLIPIMYPDGCSSKFIKKFTDWMQRANADEYFAVSNFTKDDFLKYRPDEKNKPIHTLYLGASKNFSPVKDKKVIQKVKEKYGIKTDKYFLAVSELSARKNFVHLLKSFVAFLDETKADDISLVLVGPVRKGYDAVTSQVMGFEKYKDKIVQTGFADNEDLAPLYSGSTSFIYPSCYEGFGLPVLEGMQCGAPVITADNTSLPEVGGDAVLYITGRDEKETVKALQKIYEDENLRKELSKKGIERAQKFNWESAVQVVENAVRG